LLPEPGVPLRGLPRGSSMSFALRPFLAFSKSPPPVERCEFFESLAGLAPEDFRLRSEVTAPCLGDGFLGLLSAMSVTAVAAVVAEGGRWGLPCMLDAGKKQNPPHTKSGPLL
jgi:hypothetical protein